MSEQKTENTNPQIVPPPGVVINFPGKEQKPVNPLVTMMVPVNRMQGPPIEKMSVDFTKLKSKDLDNMELEYAAIWPMAQPTNGIFMSDSKYLKLAIGRINGIKYEEICEMGAIDWIRTFGRLQAFLAERARAIDEDE